MPSTNPTSTAIYKILISLKARCAIVLSPHPAAVKCITRVAEVMDEAARRAGAPAGAINWMTTVTLEGTQELMKHRDVAVILATGGMGLVRAAYSAGKPAYGVGPGNAPAYIERTANVKKAVRDIITGKTFDNGVLCSSENSVVVDEPIAEDVKREFQAQGGYFMNAAEMDARRARAGHAAAAAESGAGRQDRPTVIAEKCGITVPADTRVLIAPLEGVGRDYPAVDRKALPGPLLLRRQGLARGLRALQADPALRRDGPHDVHPLAERTGHPRVRPEEAGVPHRRQLADDARVDRADDRARSGDDARMRRLRRQHHVGQHLAAAPAEHQAAGLRDHAGRQPVGRAGARAAPRPRRRSRPARPPPAGISAEALTRRIDEFLGSRGYRGRTGVRGDRHAGAAGVRAAGARPPTPQLDASGRPAPLDFVCEEDVRLAIQAGRKLVVSERAIVTPVGARSGRGSTASSPSRPGAAESARPIAAERSALRLTAEPVGLSR